MTLRWALMGGWIGIACGAMADYGVVVDEPVIVVARPQSAAAQPEVAPRVVYQADELARFGAQTVGDLVRRLPGVVFTSEAGGYDAPQLRGIGPEYTQLLIDGRRVPGLADDRSALVDRLPADLIERVEIIRSPTADLDAQGIGGTLNVVLRSGAAADGARLRIGSIIDDEGKTRALGHAAYGASLGPWSGYLGLTVQPEYEVRDKRARLRAADGTLLETRRGDELRDSRSDAADARLGYRFDGGSALQLDGRYLRLERDTRLREQLSENSDEGPLLARHDEREDEQQRNRGLGLRATLPLHAQFGCELFGDHNELEARRSAHVDRSSEGTTERTEDEALSVTDRETRADVRCTLTRRAGHRLRLGVAGGQQDRSARDRRSEFEDGETIDLSPFGGAYRVEERRTDAFVQTQWQLAPAWQLDTGLRAETTRVEPSAPSSDAPARTSTDTQWLPNLHLRGSPDEDAQWRASIARTLRRPEFAQLAPFRQRMDDVFFVGNPQLAPERAWGADLGYAQQFDETGIRFDGNLFYRRIDDLIQNQAVAQDTRRPANFGRGRVWGLELGASAVLDALGLHGARLDSSLTLLDSEVRDPLTRELQRFQRQPPYVFSLAYDQEFRSAGFSWGLALSRQGASREAFAESIERLRFRTGLEAYVSLELARGLELRLAGRDLLDAEVVDTTTRYDAPRPAGALESIDRERETLGPSLLISLEAKFR